MNRREFGGLILGAVAGLSTGVGSLYASPTTKSKINWEKTLRTAHDASLEQSKPLLMIFGASWCTFCHKLHRETLTDPSLAALINREFVPLALDFDKETRVVEILEVEQLPCTIVLSSEADLLLKYVGFLKPDAYLKKLQSALAKQKEIQLTKGTAPGRQR
ncbi:MAG: thioredoxin family protein [Planctomycetaceae bacterium]